MLGSRTGPVQLMTEHLHISMEVEEGTWPRPEQGAGKDMISEPSNSGDRKDKLVGDWKH
jgi:hypothetical protein